MSVSVETEARAGSVVAVFAVTIFLSASLLFFVQPMYAKMVLPHLGGAPAVWTTAMLFFQTALLTGYAYAHFLSTRLAFRRQVADLLALHTVEIVAFAAAYRMLLNWGALGDLGGSFEATWNGLIYFSGINFATLGYTQIETSGPIRMINMMQSLGGFMVLTWSATILYSVCKRAWRE